MCKDLMRREDLKLPLDKSDARGWAIAHFAAMAGNADIIDYLIAKNVRMVKLKTKKPFCMCVVNMGTGNYVKSY